MTREKCVVNFCGKVEYNNIKRFYGLTSHKEKQVCVICNHKSKEIVAKEGVYLCENINPKFTKLATLTIKGVEYKFFTIIVIRKLEVYRKGKVKALIFEKTAEMTNLFLEQTQDYNLVIYHDRAPQGCKIYAEDSEALGRLFLILKRDFEKISAEGGCLSVPISEEKDLSFIIEVCLENFYNAEEIRRSIKPKS